MVLQDFLTGLRRKGVQIRVVDGQLRVSAPPGTLTPDFVERIAEHKERLIGLLGSMQGDRRPPLIARPEATRGPLSFAQERIWFFDQIIPDTTTYNIGVLVKAHGKWDLPALERACTRLIERQCVLRTTFEFADEMPVQTIAESAPFALAVYDLRDDPDAAAESDRIRQAEQRRTFDLTTGPLLRATVISYSDEDHDLLVTVHHIAADGGSLALLFRELGEFYRAEVTQSVARLPDLPIRYIDYARWERGIASGGSFAEALDYWRDRLPGRIGALDLPTDRPRPAMQSFAGGTLNVVLDEELTESLKTLARAEQVTPYMLLLTAFGTILYRHTGSEELIIGMPVAGRERAETKNLAGMFVNMLPLRLSFAGNPSFREALARVRGVTLGALAHQDLPFAKLLEDVDPERDASRTPLFQAVVNMVTEQGEPELRLPGIVLRPPPLSEMLRDVDVHSKFDVTLYAWDIGAAIDLTLVFNADLYDAGRMKRMQARLLTLLGNVAADPSARVGDVPLVPDSAAAVIARPTVSRSDEAVPFTRNDVEQSIGERFTTVADRFPECVAIDETGRRTTYAELRAAAERCAIAIHSAASEIPRDDEVGVRVALLCGNGTPMVSAMLGAAMSGAVYVPLDPTYPVERLAYMVQDSDARIVLTTSAYRELAGSLAPDGVVVLELDGLSGGDDPGMQVVMPAPHAPAYILYTSGSTGRPKGVVQSHRNVLHHVQVYADGLRIGIGDRLTLLSSFSFDASVMDVYGALLTGATLLPMGMRPERLMELPSLIAGAGATILHATPTVFRLIADLSADRGYPEVRAVVLGGEEAQRRDAEAAWRLFRSDCTLINGLGPTESTLALQYILTRDDTLEGPTIPVGHPVDGTKVVLLDETGAVTPVRGEIGICSEHVALGYWRQPEATRQAFSGDPTGGSARVYRTGDLGLRLPDGSIVFQGRKDRQIKIRGHRIEPAEVEVAMEDHAGVTQAAVAVREDSTGVPCLVGYFVPASGAGTAKAALLRTTAADVRRHLSSRMPAYMVPAAFVAVDSLPLTPTGKVDRDALPDPGPIVAAAPYAAPRDGVDEGLAAIWSDVLGCPRVGIDDSFFDLGGTSINVGQVAARARGILGVEIPLSTFFDTPTVRALGDFVRGRMGATVDAVVEIAPAPRQGHPPLSFAQERMWVVHEFAPEETAYNVSASVLLRGPLDSDALVQSFAEVIRRHESLRTTFRLSEGRPVQCIEESGGDLDFVDLSDLSTEDAVEEARRIASDAMGAPYDLSTGPLLRLRLIRIGAHEHLLAVGFHHIVGDLWSFGVLAREVSALYRALRRGEDRVLTALPIQYADFAVWQRHFLTGERLEQLMGYWRQRLAGLPTLTLPTDRPRPVFQTFAGSSTVRELPPDLAHRLSAWSAAEGVTPFMTLLAAFNVLLSRYSGQNDIVVGVPIANRTYSAIENLIGTFVNTLVHRNDLSGAPTFRDLVQRVKNVAVGAYEHQDLPFERLVEELQPRRDTSHPPIFQVLFNGANMLTGGFEIESIRSEHFPLDKGVAQFDLSASLLISPDHIFTAFVYNTDLFDDSTAERMLAHYQRLIEAAVASPETRITELAMLSPSEEQQLLTDWNSTTVEYEDDTCWVQLFEAQVGRTPDRVAAVCGNERFSYEALNAYANRVARRLARLGVGPGDAVAVCAERSVGMLAGLLGVMKSGAAYVPIDPRYPEARIRYVLDDCSAAALVTHSWLEGSLPSVNVPVVRLDERDSLEGESGDNPGVRARPSDAVYVIYTSGSTGKPKGVQVSHRALVNFLNSMGQHPGLTEDDILLSVTTISFDISALELYLPLTVGARVVIARSESTEDGFRLAELLESTHATAMQATPATWRLLLATGWKGQLGLRVLCGGEAMSRDLADALLACAGEVWNLYGPTETTIWSTVERVVSGRDPVSIGRPIANTQVYVLDGSGRPTPVGVPGELCIGGEGLAMGYLNRPELTAERFVELQLPDGVPRRVYRTGDLVRYLGDGRLQHLGRIDHQIKVRGFRVEPGEIESCLISHPSVEEAVVIAREDRLVAYVVYRDGEDATATELRAHAAESLPAHMVPSLVVELPALPLTPNGKVDRLALPQPHQQGPAGSGASAAPVTESERLVAEIWGVLLEQKEVGLADNFFDLGGHSLLAMQAVAEIRDRTGQRFDARLMFFKNLRQIAALVDEMRARELRS